MKKTMMLLFMAAYIMLPGSANAQQNNNEKVITKEEKREIILLLCQQYDKVYIYPEKVAKLREHLINKLDAGAYDKFNAPGVYAFQLDSDIQNFTNDKHMGIGYNPKEAAEWAATPPGVNLTPSEKEKYREINYGFNKVEILEGNIGYMDMREFGPLKYAGGIATAIMTFFENCDALIIDLRNNGGGFGEVGDYIISYLVDTGDSSIVFSTYYSRSSDTYEQSSIFQYIPGKPLYNIPVYLLISKSTFSAAEAFAYNLKTLKRATIIGENTRGGENPISIRVVKKDYLAYIPSLKLLKSFSNKETKWEGVGIKPDIETKPAAALAEAHINALKTLSSKTNDENKKRKYNWAIEGVTAKAKPFSADKSSLKLYEGSYRDYTISLMNGELFYQRGDRSMMKMIPFAPDSFLIENLDYIRVKFIRDKDKVVEMHVLVDDGRIIKCVKK